MAVNKRLFAVVATLVTTGVLLLATAPPASPAIHEMVAAYCSGGGHGTIGADGFLEPPGITDMGKKNFAQPVRSSGVVVFPLITDKPAAKFPAGTDVRTLDVSQADHPSAAHCNALNP
jgi:hypothetical protein